MLDYTHSDIPYWYARIPEPHFYSSLFPNRYKTLCRPLDPPFDDYAITHFGTVFIFKKTKCIYVNHQRIIRPDQIVKKHKVKNTTIVKLKHHGRNISFVLVRLLMDRFFNIPISESGLNIDYIDNDPSNIHISNLEIYKKLGYRRLVPYEQF